MPKVTSLKPQKDNKRVNVYIDGEFRFGIDLDNLVIFGIKIEKEFSNEEIEKIIYEAEFQKTYNKLLNYATLRPRSEHELFSWLKRKKIASELHNRLFDRLNRLNLVDDETFTRWWIGQRLEFKHKSKKEIKFELLKKGVAKETINKIINEAQIDEEAAIRKLLEKRRFKDPQKAFAYLARKGFDFETIKSVIRQQADLDP